VPGERIGDAYIRIHADGAGFDKEIRKDFDPTIKSMGTEHGKAYSEAFSKELKRSGKLKHFAEGIGRSLGKFDAGSEFIDSMEVSLRELRERVGTQFGPEIGQRLADGIRDSMQRGAIQTKDQYLATIADIRPAIARITEEIANDQHEASLKLQQDRDREFDYFNNLVVQLQDVEEEIKRISAGNERFGDSLKTVKTRTKDLVRELRAQNSESKETNELLSRMRFRLVALTPRITRAQNEFNKMSDTVGRFSGRGSRNDFLNFIGSVNRNLIRLSTGVVTTFTKMISVSGRFFKELATGGVSISDLKTGFKGLFSAASGGIATLVSLGAIATLLAGSLGILSAALSGVVALLISLASTVAFAAASALPALTAAFLPLAAAAATVTVAIQSMSDAQKEALKNDFKPLIDDFKELGRSAADVLFRDMGKWAKQLRPLIDNLKPGVVGVAAAIRDTLGNAIESAAESPKFQFFMERFSQFLPNAVRKLGDVFTNVFEGIGGVLLAMRPAMNRFLRYIQDIAEKFSEWSNSRGGRAEIRKFFKDAGDSAKALGGFLGRVIDLVTDLLSAGKGTGDSIFRDMADQVQRLIDYLKDNPEALKDWLEWGKDLGESIGNVIVAIGKMIAALDSPTTRAILTFLLDGFTEMFELIGKFPQVLALLAGPLGVIYAAFKTIKDILEEIVNTSVSWGDFFGGFLGPLGGVIDGIGAIKDGISGLFSGGGGDDKFIAALIPQLRESADEAGAAADQMKALRDSLDQVTGAATGATFALARQQIQENGMLAAGQQLGFTSRQLVRAFAGEKSAIDALQPSAKRLRNMTGEQRVAYGLLLQQLGINLQAYRRERAELRRNAAESRDYSGQLKGVPRKVKTLIEATNLKPTIKSLGAFIDKARELAPNLKRRDIKTIITASGATATKGVIDKVIAKADELKKEREAKISADIKAFEQREQRVRTMLTQLENRKPVEPKISANDDQARQVVQSLVSYVNGIQFQPIYIDIVRRYSSEGNPGGSNTGNSGTPDPPSNNGTTTSGRASVTVPQINVYETADGKATAWEIMNHIAAAGY
jgi:hypothetical protein